LARAAQVVDDLAGLKRGRLMLWASQTIAGYRLPRHITRFKKSTLKLKSLSSSAMPQAFPRL
jgi:hypothetical protein